MQVMQEGSQGVAVSIATPANEYIYKQPNVVRDIFTFVSKPGPLFLIS